nr:hypothetical protein CFP56_02936 [Quercus suber]
MIPPTRTYVAARPFPSIAQLVAREDVCFSVPMFDRSKALRRCSRSRPQARSVETLSSPPKSRNFTVTSTSRAGAILIDILAGGRVVAYAFTQIKYMNGPLERMGSPRKLLEECCVAASSELTWRFTVNLHRKKYCELHTRSANGESRYSQPPYILSNSFGAQKEHLCYILHGRTAIIRECSTPYRSISTSYRLVDLLISHAISLSSIPWNTSLDHDGG